MSQKDIHPDENFSITLSDLGRLCKRGKTKILWSAIGVGFLGLLFSLTKPVEYKAEATFREKGTKQSNIGGSVLAEMFSAGLGQQDNEAISTIRSRQFMKDVIEKLGLQATITQSEDSDSYLSRLFRHLKAEYFEYNSPLHPSLQDRSCCLKISAIQYNKETPVSYKVKVLPKGTFQVFDGKQKLLGEGNFGIPFIQDSFQFTLNQDGQPIIPSSPYIITLWPMNFRADWLLKKLDIKMEKTDKNLLKLTFQDGNRHLACEFLNSTMDCYQDYLKTFHDKQSNLQLAYLQQRQDETGLQLFQLMHKHAQSLSTDLTKVGFSDSEKEMEFLAANQHQFKERILSNELEMKRLHSVLSGKCVYYDHYGTTGDSSVINNVLENIRRLQQQRDSLQLSLSQSTFLNAYSIQNTFNEQFASLKKVQVDSEELDKIIVAYKNGTEPDISSKLFQDPRFLLKTWHNSLFTKDGVDKSQEPNAAGEWEKRQEHFLFYLENIKRLLGVHEKIIQERLTHQQNPSLEFQGVSLETANELYVNYSKRLNEIHAEIQQDIFIAHQIEDPDFEISSLSSSLKDPVSQEMISRASQLLLQLKDENNRSTREQDRLKDELALQRNFLLLHIQQMTSLLKLNQKLNEEKIYDLQNITLELIHQNISLFENNLKAYISSRLENIKQERLILQQHLEDIQMEMATLPERWVAEKLIDQNVKTNELIVQEIAKMVEFKNINHKLELIQSAPVDIAVPSLHPISTRPIFYMFLGAFLGALSSMGYILAGTLKKGLPASISNLNLLNQHVSGTLSKHYQPRSGQPLRDQDLDTLRRIQGFFSDFPYGQGNNNRAGSVLGNKLLLIEGQGPDYAFDLANLFDKKGLKVILLSLSFNQTSSSEQPGLLQYLSGDVNFPTITHHEYGDHVEAGGITRFAIELLGTSRFQEFLSKLQVKYDWIIAVSDSRPYSAESENLIPLFPNIAVTVVNDTLPELCRYTSLGLDSDTKLTFVIADQDE